MTSPVLFVKKNMKLLSQECMVARKKTYNFEFSKYDKKSDEMTPDEYEFEITNNFEDFDDNIGQIKKQLPHGCKSAFELDCVDTQVSIETKQPNFEINFNSPKSIGKVLDYEQTVLKSGNHDAEREFKVPYENIFMTCNHLESSYFNSQRRDILHSFTVTKQGYVYTLPAPVYLKTLGKPKDMYITLVDIDNNKIDFDECDLLVNLHLKPC
jgi:hypothetical protein